MPESLYRHFIRGYFDGDGTVCESIFKITAYRGMAENIQSILVNKCRLNNTKLIEYPAKDVDIVDISYGGKKQLKRIFQYLYNDSNIYLSRKYSKFISSCF